MRKFIKHIVLFGIGFTIFNLGVYHFIVYPLLWENYLVEKEEWEPYHKIMFADSHGRSIYKDHLKVHGIYNFSSVSESYFDIYIKLNYLLECGADIDTIYLTADDHTLSPYREKANNLYRSIVYSDYKSYNKVKPEVSKGRYLFEKHVIPYFPVLNTGNSKLLLTVAKQILSGQAKGVFGKKKKGKSNKKSWADKHGRIKLCEKRFKSQFSFKNQSNVLKENLLNIIELCDRKNITVIGLRFPLSNDYLKTIGVTTYEARKVFIEKQKNVIDLRGVFKDEDQLFKDQDHVNGEGSARFTELLFK